MFDTAEAPPPPSFAPAVFDRIQSALETDGPVAAVDRLCEELRQADDLQAYFYAKLMRKRVELGVPPFPTGPAADLPPETHETYEETIRDVGREVGQAYLDRGDIARAWAFFRLIGEPEPVRQALEAYQPGADDDPYPAIEVAWQHAVHPQKGFDLVLDRNGVCSAITMVHSSDLSTNPELRTYCIRQLVNALHAQLRERVQNDLSARGSPPPEEAALAELLTVRADLFDEDTYHIDVSHLSSIAQMALHLPPGPELDRARELCLYGARLSPSLKGSGDTPFEDTYADYKIYLDIVAGENADAGLQHFREKITPGLEEGNSYPAEVFINLLVKLDRPADALAAAKEFLPTTDDRQLTCPSVTELARQLGDFATLADAARTRSDPVNYLAGLIAARTPTAAKESV
ncbi:MAG: hypothetical protein LC104_02150 [Bacteroidales bacterium]|nr:hypothetical protein [Bacteroidales bacterium]